MKIRIVYKADNTVSVIRPVSKSKRPDETEEEWLDRVFSKAMQGELSGLPFDDVEESDVQFPPRDKRNLWRGDKGLNFWTIDDPEIQKRADVQAKKDAIKAKMGLSDQDLDNLKEALRE